MVRAMDNSTTEDSRSRAVESQVLKCGVKDWCHAHIGMDRGEQSRSHTYTWPYTVSSPGPPLTGRTARCGLSHVLVKVSIHYYSQPTYAVSRVPSVQAALSHLGINFALLSF